MSKKKKKGSNVPKAQILDRGSFQPRRPSSKWALSVCVAFAGIFFIYGEKKMMFQGYVIFNATLLDFTVK